MSRKVRLCFFGDSLVNGTGDDECLGWVGRLCAAERCRGRDLTVYNLGVRRDTSADILGRWRREAEARLPPGCDGGLVFSFGVNDCASNDDGSGPRVAPQATLANAREILGAASAWLPTLMIGPPALTDDARRNAAVARISADLNALCDALGAPFLDMIPASRFLCAQWRAEAADGDGVHPNQHGYDSMAEWIHRSRVWRRWIGPAAASASP